MFINGAGVLTFRLDDNTGVGISSPANSKLLFHQPDDMAVSFLEVEYTGINVTGHITASGNISASGDIIASGFVSASSINISTTTAATADAAHYSVNGSRVEVRNQLQEGLENGTFAKFELRNTSINAGSIVLGSFTGNHSDTNMSGSIITAATIGNSTASIFIHNETGGNIANDTPFTASFIVM